MKNLLIAAAAAFFSINCFAWEKATLVQEGELYSVKMNIPTKIDVVQKMTFPPMAPEVKVESYKQVKVPAKKLDIDENQVGLPSGHQCVLVDCTVDNVQDKTTNKMSKVLCFAGVGESASVAFLNPNQQPTGTRLTGKLIGTVPGVLPGSGTMVSIGA